MKLRKLIANYLPKKEESMSYVNINVDIDKIKNNVKEKKVATANKIINYLDKKYNKKEK